VEMMVMVVDWVFKGGGEGDGLGGVWWWDDEDGG